MFKNYFKIAWRNLLKQKGFSLINITGLSIGIAACLLISLFIYHETSYGKQVPNHENIYRLTQYFHIDGEDLWGAHHPAIMASTVKNEFEEVQKAGRIMDNNLFFGSGNNEVTFGNNPKQFHESGFAYAMHKWLEGFAYRIEIHWWIFLEAGFLAILIASMTISFQAIKAAIANPVKSLRTE